MGRLATPHGHVRSIVPPHCQNVTTPGGERTARPFVVCREPACASLTPLAAYGTAGALVADAQFRSGSLRPTRAIRQQRYWPRAQGRVARHASHGPALRPRAVQKRPGARPKGRPPRPGHAAGQYMRKLIGRWPECPPMLRTPPLFRLCSWPCQAPSLAISGPAWDGGGHVHLRHVGGTGSGRCSPHRSPGDGWGHGTNRQRPVAPYLSS